LKSTMSFMMSRDTESHPARGAWIEINETKFETYRQESHPARGAWIEILLG
jgi:predicted RNA-binding protein YlxR (DUF448 family)